MLKKLILSASLLCAVGMPAMNSYAHTNIAMSSKQKKNSVKYKFTQGSFSFTYTIYDDNTFIAVIMDTKEGTSNTQTGTWEMHDEFENVIIFLAEEDFPAAFMFIDDDMIEVDEEFNFVLDENNQVTRFKRIK